LSSCKIDYKHVTILLLYILHSDFDWRLMVDRNLFRIL